MSGKAKSGISLPGEMIGISWGLMIFDRLLMLLIICEIKLTFWGFNALKDIYFNLFYHRKATKT
ncbi:MAG: hypothetical protein JXA03_02165, partial [Bacteroidales bacterium]|nr:hypothetical protein [Bacteroidales bacterium]